MKPTKEEITPEKFFIKKNIPEADENGSYDFVPFPEQTMDLEELYELMQEYAEAFHKEKIGDTSIDALDFVHQWFYKLSIGQTTQGEVADAIEQFHKEKLREDIMNIIISYHCELPDNIVFLPENAKKVIDEYLNTLNTK